MIEKLGALSVPELKVAAASDSCCNILQIVRGTGRKKSSASETVCEVVSTPIINNRGRLRQRVEFFEDQFSWFVAFPPPPATLIRLFCCLWRLTTDSLDKNNVSKELQFLSHNISPGANNLTQLF